MGLEILYAASQVTQIITVAETPPKAADERDHFHARTGHYSLVSYYSGVHGHGRIYGYGYDGGDWGAAEKPVVYHNLPSSGPKYQHDTIWYEDVD